MANIANYWAEHGQQVTLISLASSGEDFYPLHPGVCRMGLNLIQVSPDAGAAVKNNVRRLKQLRQVIKASQPDVVISFIDQMNVLTLVASVGLGIPVIVCEHTDPYHHDIGFIWSNLRRLFYRRATAIVMLTNELRGWAEQFVNAHGVRVIPNPVSAVEPSGGSDWKHPRNTIVAVGRLEPVKGFDLLLEAFARCAEKHFDWSLIIIGEGKERGSLEALSGQLGIKDRVEMPGLIQDPFRILRGADLFVLSSRYEGIPLALLEAMACGLAAIATDCSTGPREVIRDGVDGVLVRPNDVDALASAMDRLMTDSVERKRLGMCAADAVERFKIDKVMNMWDELLSYACPGGGK